MKGLPVLAIAALALGASGVGRAATVASSEACASDAIAQAGKLMASHFGDERNRQRIDGEAKRLPSIANPADPKQRLEVLEVWGYLYKGRHRMRFEYFRKKDGDCVLMRQEIIEYARL